MNDRPKRPRRRNTGIPDMADQRRTADTSDASGPANRSEIAIYRTEDGRDRIQVRLEGRTVYLTQAGLASSDLHAIELHERSAAHALAACRELGAGTRKAVNRWGGSIALGDVPGATMLRHLIALDRRLAPGERGMLAAAAAGVCGAALVEGGTP